MAKGFKSLSQTMAHAHASSDEQVTKQPKGRFVETVDDTREERVKKFIGRNGIMIVAVIIAVLALIITSSISSSRAKALDKQKSEIVSLNQEYKTKDQEHTKDVGQAIRQATGGIDEEHRKKDEEVARQLFRDALTWDGIPSYLEARDKVKRVYHLDDTSDFMTVFMPGEMQGVVRKAPSGKVYYSNDENLKSTFDTMNTVVTGVNGDVYSYWAEVKARVESDNGRTSKPMSSVVTFDVVDSKIANIRANTAPVVETAP